MSLQSERIQVLMQRLGLTEMVHGYETLSEQAAQKNLPYCDFLEQVLESEANVRQERNTFACVPHQSAHATGGLSRHQAAGAV